MANQYLHVKTDNIEVNVPTKETLEKCLDSTEEVIERLNYYGDKDIIPSSESYFTVNSTGETITGLTDTGKTQTELVIPYKINGIEITTLFSGRGSSGPPVSILGVNNKITKVVIPNSVTNIRLGAFHLCKSLTSINIPNSVTSIEGYAFDNCSSLTSINIPNSVTSIGGNAFQGCTSLTSINIPNSVTSIGNSIFNGCPSLTKIEIPNSVTSIGGYAFANCSSLTSINIPNSVTSISSTVFNGCTNLAIYCEQGSYAETYAKSKNIPVVYTDIDPSKYLTKDNTTEFTPTADYQPATKKYVDDKIGIGNKLKLIGETPITLNNDTDIITLISKEECQYTIQSITLSDFDTSVVTYKNTSRTNNKDCIEIEATSDATVWHQTYANITISNLIVGEQYTLYINTLGISIDSTNHITNGYFTVFTSDMEIIKDGIYLNNNDKFSLPIIPTTTSIIIRWYVGDGSSFAANCKARINNIYINKGIENSSYSSPINLSGTFIGEKEFLNIKSGVTITSTPTCSVYSKEIEKESKPLSGKTIVCFGDSLFGLHRGETSATSYIAEETGATVYNVGFGGCRMSTHPSTGYAEFSMWALAKAIHDNDWIAQDGAVSSGVDYFTEQLDLLKSIDFNNVDIAIIHYGTNDFNGGIGIGADSPADSYLTLCGALRYSIEQLLSAYPKLRIYVSVPVFRYWTAEDSTVTYSDSYTNDNNNTLVEFVEAIKAVAKEYHLPCIDGYYGLGVNKINASTFLSDGTHFNDIGRKRFGTYIGSQIISNM